MNRVKSSSLGPLPPPLPKSPFLSADPLPLTPRISTPLLPKPPLPKLNLIVKGLYHEYYIQYQMPSIDLNDSITLRRKNFGNTSFETIFTNRKNDQGKLYEGGTKNISVFNDQFFLERKRFRYANINTQLTTKPDLLKNLLRYFRRLSR